jgi:hypothetical protein
MKFKGAESVKGLPYGKTKKIYKKYQNKKRRLIMKSPRYFDITSPPKYRGWAL